jgi:hypothetical protein
MCPLSQNLLFAICHHHLATDDESLWARAKKIKPAANGTALLISDAVKQGMSPYRVSGF